MNRPVSKRILKRVDSCRERSSSSRYQSLGSSRLYFIEGSRDNHLPDIEDIYSVYQKILQIKEKEIVITESHIEKEKDSEIERRSSCKFRFKKQNKILEKTVGKN